MDRKLIPLNLFGTVQGNFKEKNNFCSKYGSAIKNRLKLSPFLIFLWEMTKTQKLTNNYYDKLILMVSLFYTNDIVTNSYSVVTV